MPTLARPTATSNCCGIRTDTLSATVVTIICGYGSAKPLPVVAQGVSTHWPRHTTLTWVERNFGHAVARAYAGHAKPGHAKNGATDTYVVATQQEVIGALAALTGESHPLAGV